MDRRIKRYIDKLLLRQTLRRWQMHATGVEQVDLARLQELRADAKSLRQPLDNVIRVADSRLALPRVGSSAMRKVAGADWSWRPDLWRFPLARPGHCAISAGTPLDAGVKLFHDCTLAEMAVRQVRSGREADLAPFAVQIDVLEFQGSFLSLVIDVPPEGLSGLTREHILRVDCGVETERPLEVFARLNLRHGTRSEQVVREMPVDAGACFAEFDLAYTSVGDNRIEAAWLDLIFENPRLNQLMVRDVTVNRRLRAQL